MATSVNTAVSLLQRAFPDCDATTAAEYLTIADRTICSEIPVRITTEDVTLVAGTPEYALSSEDILRIWAVRYLKNATNSWRLTETDITKLDLESGDWRALPRQEPRKFYIANNSSGAAIIGLVQTPLTGTSGSYPTVRAYVTKGATLAGGGSLPATIKDSNCYVFCAAWRYAMDRARDEEPFWNGKYMDAINRERDFQFKRSAYDEPGFVFPYAPRGGVV